MSKAFIAVDWGTTHRRAYRIEDGVLIDERRDECGAARLSPDAYPDAVAQIRVELGDLPLLIAGMAGSDFGWRRTPYVKAPVDLASLAPSVAWVGSRSALLPGVACHGAGRSDIMRGEEMQALGVLAAKLARPGDLICQPGTHCKWITTRDMSLETFTTAMTGELFALLGGSTVLRASSPAERPDEPSFLQGVEIGAQGDLLAAVFSTRARIQLGDAPQDPHAYVSGILVGADVAARRVDRAGEIIVLDDGPLGDLYTAAITTLGGRARIVSARKAFIAGMAALWRLL